MFRDIKRHYPATIVMLLILLIGSWYLYSDSMDKYPAYIHAWTQTDRLALAMNFQENGFDFFHPATYNLQTIDGITQVDFPIHDYLVALISSALKTNLVSTFRYYNLIYSLIGLFFFFRLSLLITKSDRRAIWATSFLFTIPVIVYYQNGFLPSIPSFANFIIGLYAFFYYQKSQKKTHFYWAVAFLTLAALSRSPYLIFLFALLLHRLVVFIFSKSFKGSEFFPILIGLASFIGYFIYNQSLANKYGSMFLSELLYVDNLSTLKGIVKTFIERFGNEILSPYHAIALTIILIATFPKITKPEKVSEQWLSFMLYFIISAIGVVLFFFAMGKQFKDHDYYFIDSFYPILILLLISALSILKIPEKWYLPSAISSIALLFLFFNHARGTQTDRYTPPYNDRVHYAYNCYINAKDDFQEWGIKKSDTLLVLDANTTNMPFTIWGNRGYTELYSREDKVKAVLDSSFTYAVLLDSNFLLATYKDYPRIIEQLKLVHTNGEISLYKKTAERNPHNFFEHFHYFAGSNFDDISTLDPSSIEWAIYRDTEMGKSLAITEEREYALTIQHTLKEVNQNKDLKVLVVADYMPISDTAKVRLVCEYGDYYGAEYLKNFITDIDQWQKRMFRFNIPAEKLKENSEIKIYYWNPDFDNLYIDNYNILIYQ